MSETKPINAPSPVSAGREMKVRKNVVAWLATNLERKGTTKTALADACGVRKQSVSNWFTDGRVKPANILAAAAFFGVEPPYDLMNSHSAEYSDPMSYPWKPEFRELVGQLVRDNEKSGTMYTKRARALSSVYEAMSFMDYSESIRKSYISEINDAVRIKHVFLVDAGGESTIKQYGDYIYLVSDGVQIIVLPSSPSDDQLVIEAIIALSQTFESGLDREAYVGDIGSVGKKILESMNVEIKHI
ncbi:XRE family transcriptional regulator [Vibrio parahaemolyticus]|nr:XRE family transcriptional regulator [Vibrio parahaemolyticus]